MSLEDKIVALAETIGTDVRELINSKVDKELGKGLSDTNFTQAEKDKLAGLESSHFKGEFTSLAALLTAFPVASAGDYASVDEGVGFDVIRYVWDTSDSAWLPQLGTSTQLSASQIKEEYESNPDTNVFSDIEKSKLDGIALEATKNRTDSENADKLHTHELSDVAGLETVLADKASKTELNAELALKADKVEGKVFSDTNFTQAEKDKLASLENYSDTNPFTDVEKTKLNDIEVKATKNRADSANADKVHTHTTAQVTGLDTTLAGKADKTTQVIAGTGLSGGGSLESNRTLTVNYGTAVGTAAQGNDSRLSNSRDWTADVVTQAEAEAGSTTTARKWTAQRVAQAIKALGLTIGTTASTAKAGNWMPTWADVTGKPTTFTPSAHTHSLSQITGAGSVASLNTNASTANFLRGDGTWVTPPNTDTTYSEITTAEIDAGTASTSRTITGRRMKYALGKKADTGTQVIAGTGLSGGGTLAANRTLNVSYGTTAGTATQGNDSRIANAVPNSRTISAGTGLSGGGNLTANRTLSVSYGTAAGTAAQGNDTRIVNAVPNTRTITAGTGLSGGGTLASNLTLNVSYGTTAGTATQGNDSRITGAFQKSQVVQSTGTSTTNVMSQKATTEAIANIPSVSKTSAYTVVAADKGKSIDTTSNVTIRASVFIVGDVIVVTNTSATNSSILAASGVTIRLAGSTKTGTLTLAGYGVATLRMVTSNVWFASGAGLK